MGLFSNQASYYSQYRPHYPEAMYQRILDEVSGRGVAWDCGTGNGQVAVQLANYFGRVIASDISDGQLSLSEKRANIQYMNLAAEEALFARDEFDLITVGQAIHWFDFTRFYEVVQYCLKPVGVLAVFGYGQVEIRHPEIHKIVSGFYVEMFSRYFSAKRKFVTERYETIPFPFQSLGNFSFESVYEWDIDHLRGYLYSWSCVQRHKDEGGTDPTLDILSDISGLWTTPLPVSFPIFLKLGRKLETSG